MDRLAIRSGEGQMKAFTGNGDFRGAKPDGKFIAAARVAIADGGAVGPDANISESCKRGIVERGGARKVHDRKRKVVQHRCRGIHSRSGSRNKIDRVPESDVRLARASATKDSPQKTS